MQLEVPCVPLEVFGEPSKGTVECPGITQPSWRLLGRFKGSGVKITLGRVVVDFC